MYLRFLGTGAADWQQPEPSGEFRRNASMLVDGSLLMDGNATILDMLPTPSGVEDMFFTHSHDDHFSAEAVRAIAPKRVYAHESWAAGIDAGHATAQGFSVAMVVAACIAAAGCALALVYSRAAVKRDAKRA